MAIRRVSNASIVLFIGAFGFSICLGFRASYFEFLNYVRYFLSLNFSVTSFSIILSSAI
jgi:hypothetical protein